MKKFQLLLLLLLPVLCAGCINYSEESWLDANGSGKISMEISTSEQFAALIAQENSGISFSQKELEQPFKDLTGIKLEGVKIYHQNGNQIATVNFKFTSFKALNHINNSNGVFGFLGKISFIKDKKGQLVFTRTIAKINFNHSTQTDGTSNNGFADSISAAMLSGYNWKYTIHFPGEVLSANTANDNINTKTNTVVWEIPLAKLLANSQTLTATIATPNPWFIYIIVAGALLVVAIFILVITKFAKKPKVM
jgi:hypothetical protein